MLFMLFVWIGFAVVAAFAAQARGRGFWEWLIIGALTGVFGFIAVLVMQPVEAEEAVKPGPRARGVDGSSGERQAVAPVPLSSPFDLPKRKAVTDNGYFGQEVVGESYYLDNLRRLMGGQEAPEKGRRFTAVLSPEPDNPVSENAVRVLIDGLLVGYLPRGVSVHWLVALVDAGCDGEDVQVPARIFSARDKKLGSPLRYGVWLDLAPDFEVLP